MKGSTVVVRPLVPGSCLYRLAFLVYALSAYVVVVVDAFSSATCASRTCYRYCREQQQQQQQQRRRQSLLALNLVIDNVPMPSSSTPSPLSYNNNDIPVIEQAAKSTSSSSSFGQGRSSPSRVRYSDFLKLVNDNRIQKVTFSADGQQLMAVDNTNGMRLTLEALPSDPDLLTQLVKHNVDITVLPGAATVGGDLVSGLASLVQSFFFPAALFAGLLFFLRRRQGIGGFGDDDPMNYLKSKARVQLVSDTGVTFDEVAGCDGAKLELAEVVDFLKQPEAYTKNGCRIPRGVILDGPPGTGKTLLAKAVAGEAQVPFISISGSEFVEMFVGVGASRVRDIFAQAKKHAPCIIFIDEIDAVGRKRGAGYAGGNDEREQTVNQILVEMDGFHGNPGIITIAATNRIDILDQALLRPGRFDRRITVDLPDFKGRTNILVVHTRNKPLEPDVDLEAISRITPGFSGAELENLMNEAAITAARKSKATIGWEEIDAALDRIMIGLEKKGGSPQLKQKELIAYHEAGHAIVGALVPDYDQVQKITIIPHSDGAGGLTLFAPQESRLESGMYSRHYLESQLAVALGGRLAEEIIYGEDMVTTGASNDIQHVASIAKRMVKEWGMSDKLGPMALVEPQAPSFMGLNMLRRPTQWGNKIMSLVEEEVERLVNNSYLIAQKILKENGALLEHLAKTLMDQEVVSAEEFQMMLVNFKAHTIDYATLSSELNREKLPFQHLPSTV